MQPPILFSPLRALRKPGEQDHDAPVASLVPYASNSRTHTPAQLDKLARSLKEFGFTNPILLDGENGIIASRAPAG
jgi:ParB-like chromosome segregation protein Spo0J